MNKRMFGLALAAVLVLGAGGVAFAAAAPERASYGVDEALELAAEPSPPSTAAAGKKQELQACVKPKVDAGAARGDALRECAAQLGVPAPGPGRPGRPGKGGRRDGLPFVGKAAHAELVVPKPDAAGQWETVVLDRGTITAVSAESITLLRPDGPTVTIRVVPATKVRGAGSVAELTPGRHAVVVSAGGEARAIVARR
jgi:hypothetical protein